jgi:hypothetical protein
MSTRLKGRVTRMVNLVEDWKILAEYSGDKQGLYQILESGKNVEIRVSTGRLGFRKEFAADDPELAQIREFCTDKQFIRVSENIRDEIFFK